MNRTARSRAVRRHSSAIFPEAAGVFSKSSAVAKKKVVPPVSKDGTTAVHSGEAF